jgi:bifunctional UDP-N-acetylglucosamine pyrophosphorylase/glucosamine-1-phosphate N-acetyltransferase
MSADTVAAIILAAGKGTRMKSEQPKVLHALAGLPMVAFPIRLALDLGARPLVVVVGEGGAVETEIRSRFPDAPIRIALQAEQKGTAHAVLAARESLKGFNGKVLILYGDVPLLQSETLKRLAAAADRKGLALVSTRPADPTGYGRVVRGRDGLVRRIVEQRDCGPAEANIAEVNAGIYCVDAELLWNALDRVGDANAQHEFYLTDLVAQAAERGEVPVITAPIEEVAGVNDRADLAEAGRRLRRAINRAHLLAGVTMIDPEQTYVDAEVRLGRDVTIEPGCVLAGHTVVHDGARIRAHSVLEDAEVGEGAQIGPFARLRPGTVLAAEVHVGNFVETKNTRMGERSKANHHAYLGDTTIGSGVNVGAGTIVCNYDGVKKHRTVFEDGVFVGSNATVVAPAAPSPRTCRRTRWRSAARDRSI